MDKITAARAIRKLAIQFEAMAEAANTLEAIGSAEQAEAEVKARVAALRTQEAEARQAMAGVVEEADRVRTAAATVLADANKRADEIRAEAEDILAAAMNAAEARASAIVDNANEAAKRAKSEAAAKVEAIQREGLAATVALASVVDDLAARKSELAEVTAKTEQAKAALRQFVGA